MCFKISFLFVTIYRYPWPLIKNLKSLIYEHKPVVEMGQDQGISRMHNFYFAHFNFILTILNAFTVNLLREANNLITCF